MFCFDKRWAEFEGIQEVVNLAWQQEVLGSPMYKVAAKIKATRIALLQWKRQLTTNSAKDIERLNRELFNMEDQGPERDWGRWNRVKEVLDRAYI